MFRGFRARRFLVMSATLLTLASLSGCGKKVLDERNVQIDNGKIFEKDANTPFTGTLTNISEQDIIKGQEGFGSIIASGYSNFSNNGTVRAWAMDHAFCDVSVSDGYLDGKATCKVEQTDNVIGEFNFDHGVLTGSFKANIFNAPDKELVEGQFKDGKPDGTIKFFNLSGKVQLALSYEDGIRNGTAKAYNENGDLIGETNYKDDKADGVSTNYSPDGKIKVSEMTFKQGVKDGEEIDRDPTTGNKTFQGTLLQGQIEGDYKTWNSDGVLTGDKTIHAGNVVSDRSPGAAPPEPTAPAATPQPAPAPTSAVAALSEPTAPAAASSAPAAGLSACQQGWIDAFHKEQGDDTPIAADQLDEWDQWCKAGKMPPTK
jgi:antitoxin component YwqK of YwqJK toxin-antitoxin module